MFSQLLNIKTTKRKLFKRHFIRSVILEFNFANLKKETILQHTDSIKSKFSELGFKRFVGMKQIEFKMTSDKDTPEQITNDKETIGLLLFNDEKRMRIEILENKMIISIFKYLNFDDFIAKVEKMISILKEVAPKNDTLTRIALRKQNSIISTETTSFEDLRFIFRKPLLSALHEKAIPFENFDYTKDEFRVIKSGYKCRVSSDCQRKTSNEFEINLTILVVDNVQDELCNISKKLKAINDFNFSVFCWATTGKFKKIMNEEIE